MATCLLTMIIWLVLPHNEPVAKKAKKAVFEIIIETPTEQYHGSLVSDQNESELSLSTRIYDSQQKLFMVSKSYYETPEEKPQKRELISISTSNLPQKSTLYFRKTTNDDEQNYFELEAQWHSLELFKKEYAFMSYCSVFEYAYQQQTSDPAMDCPQSGLVYFDPQKLLGFYGQLAQDVDKSSMKVLKSPATPQQSVIVWSDPNGYSGFGAGSIKMTLRRITKIGSIK